jgi:Skp family chaperone for outer membrane proteins
MKWTILTVAILAAAGTAYLVGGTVAQQPVATTSLPKATKVGVVDIALLFKVYSRTMRERWLGPELKPFWDEEEKLKKLIDDWQKALANPNSNLTTDQTEQGKRTIRDCERRLEDLGLEFRTRPNKRRVSVEQLYKEIADAIRSYSVAHGYHLILGFGEPIDGDLHSAMNVTRKLDATNHGDIVPTFFAGALDISSPVLEILNRTAATP